jgi:hypothetical protein
MSRMDHPPVLALPKAEVPAFDVIGGMSLSPDRIVVSSAANCTGWSQDAGHSPTIFNQEPRVRGKDLPPPSSNGVIGRAGHILGSL